MSATLKEHWAKLGAIGRHSSFFIIMAARAYELSTPSGEVKDRKLLLVTVLSTTFAARITDSGAVRKSVSQ